MATGTQTASRMRIGKSDFLQAYIITMRPYLMFVSGIAGIAGLSFAPPMAGMKVLLVALAAFLSYGFGQALTDCFQTDTDSLSAPYRPLTQGVLTIKNVLAVSTAGLAACVLVFGIYHPVNMALGVAGGIGLATYTPFKRLWWAGPLYNAWIVCVLFGMAFLAGSGNAAAVLSKGLWLTAVIVFFGYANFVLSGYFKDIEADRVTGYRTFPVVFGRKRSAIASDVLACFTLLPAGLYAIPHAMNNLAAPAFFAGGTLALVLGQMRLHRTRTDAQAHGAIAPIVHGYILILSSVAVAQKPAWGLWLAMFYFAFLVTMRCRPSRQQI
jgi:4-hydroxybenzoate polyprenyltransferase